MKRILVVAVLFIFLTGCKSDDTSLQRPMKVRENLLKSKSCSFLATITADYTDKFYSFQLSCRTDSDGSLHFEVVTPDTIKGISGVMNALGGKLTFDDVILAFPSLADGQLSPVSAPWIFMNTLRSGFIESCGNDGEKLQVNIDDSYEENPIHLTIWLDRTDTPIRAEILYKGKRILSMDVKDFIIQ